MRAIPVAARMGRFATVGLHKMISISRTPLRFAVLALLASACAAALAASVADPLPEDKKQALADFKDAYRLAELWPQMAPKIARDSLPRLEDATHADIDADKLADGKTAEAAHARVAPLLTKGRRQLEAALQAFDADELAAYTAYSIYGKYFETAEIRDIAAFFGSDTGKKLTTLAPAILVESRKPGAGDVMARHFSEPELKEITRFWDSPLGRKMNETAEPIREEMHAHFIERSEASLQSVARRLASEAESGQADADPAAPAPATP
jgi:hypothetical protein